MNFAVPSAILLAALALPIIAFYILKVRMRRVPVSTNLFWKQIFDERPPRSLWQHFRHLMSLLAQLLILSSLVLAFADPYFPWQIRQARRLVLVIDPSASMKSTDISPTRFQAAIQSAGTIVDGLRFRDELAIVVAGPTPEVAVGMTGHIPTLRRALSKLQPTDNPTSLHESVQLAKQLVGDHKHKQIVVLTDACDSSLRVDPTTKTTALDKAASVEAASVKSAINVSPLENSKADNSSSSDVVEVQYRVFATEASNIGIHQFQVRRSLIDPIGYEILVGVLNASETAVRCRLELELEEAVVDVIPLDLKPNEKWSRAIEKTSLEGGKLAAKLTKIETSNASSTSPTSGSSASDSSKGNSGNDASSGSKLNALSMDDNAWAILPARKVQKVLIVTPGNLFLTKVFQANPLVDVKTVKELPTQWPSDTLLVLHQIHPEIIPPQNVLLVDPLANSDLWEQGGVVDNPIITEIDKASPLMHHIRLDNVLVPEAKKLQFKSQAKSLAGTLDKTPVFAELRREAGKCLVLSVDLEKSDLAFRTVFPIMVANALGWFSGNVGELRESQSTGSFMRFPTKEKWKEIPSDSVPVLVDPNNEEFAIASPAETTGEPYVHLGPFQYAGIWRVAAKPNPKTDSGEKRKTKAELMDLDEIAVNLSSANETDIRPSKSMLDEKETAVLASGWFSKPIWYYLVALATLLVAIEWFLYQRRIIT